MKSFADLPADVLLEHALSPPCSSHSIQLNHNGNSTEPEPQSLNAFSRLKRRWSLFPLRRSKRNFSNSNDLNRKNRVSLPPESRITSKNDEPESETTEIVLMSPDERVKLLSDQYCSSSIVPINVSQKYFSRLSSTRRSLIHVKFIYFSFLIVKLFIFFL